MSLINLSSNTPTLLENSQEKNNEDDLNTENLEIEVGQDLANTLLPIKCHSIFGPCS